MSDDHPRLIEVAFPLKQASLDSVHEKDARRGDICVAKGGVVINEANVFEVA